MIELLTGDTIDILHTLPDESVQCVVTSPPYWQLRDYEVDGQYGLEHTLESYLAQMVDVFREVRRVLRSDGVCFINMGDTCNVGKIKSGDSLDAGGYSNDNHSSSRRVSNLSNKDIIGVPWRLAFALQSDGWCLRQDIIWEKTNGCPESATDRCTRTHEYVFMLTKSDRYFFDNEAIKEPVTGNAHRRGKGVNPKARQFGRNSKFNVSHTLNDSHAPRNRQNESFSTSISEGLVEMRNKRTIWRTAVAKFHGEHYASYPEELVEPCILSGTSEAGACAICGKPYKRIVEKVALVPTGHGTSNKGAAVIEKYRGEKSTEHSCFTTGMVWHKKTVGFEKQCPCDCYETKPCVVLDPFSGTGTTGLVAAKHGRDYIGIDIKPEYKAMAQKRILDGIVQNIAKGVCASGR